MSLTLHTWKTVASNMIEIHRGIVVLMPGSQVIPIIESATERPLETIFSFFSVHRSIFCKECM